MYLMKISLFFLKSMQQKVANKTKKRAPKGTQRNTNVNKRKIIH